MADEVAGFGKWMLTLMGVLAAAGIVQTAIVWANDGKQDLKIQNVESQANRHEVDIHNLLESRITVLNRLDNMDRSMARMAAALEKLVEAEHTKR